MKKGLLQDTLKKLRSRIDLEILIYTVFFVLAIYFIFWTLTLSVGEKESEIEIEGIKYIEQSDSQNIYSSAPVEMSKVVELDINEAQLLMKLAWSEAGNQGIEGQLVIMNVVMNRVADENFPDTVKEVVYQKLGSHYQFSVVGNGVLQRAEPTEETHLALAELESGKDISEGALYFEASSKKNWHKENRTFLFENYGQRFYK